MPTVVFEELDLIFESVQSTIEQNRADIMVEKRRVSDVLSALQRLERENQRVCPHPRERQVGEYCQYTDGYTECTVCGKTW